MPYKGRQVNVIGFAKESTRNTFNSTVTRWIPLRSWSADSKNEYRDDMSSFGRREAQLARDLVKAHAESEAEFTLDADLLGEVLQAAYGAVVSVQNATTGSYKHTFSGILNDVFAPTATWHYLKGDIGWTRTPGTVVSKVEFSISDTDATVKVSLMGLREETGTSQTVAVVKFARPLTGINLVSKYATTVAGLSSGTSFKVRSLNITIDLGAKEVFELGSLNPSDMIGNGTTFEIKFSAFLRNSTFYTAFKGGTDYAFSFDLTGTNLPVLGTSTDYPRVAFTVAQATPEITHSSDQDELVSFDCTLKAEYSPTDGFAMKTELQNTTATY